jgi:hypothetical protein
MLSEEEIAQYNRCLNMAGPGTANINIVEGNVQKLFEAKTAVVKEYVAVISSLQVRCWSAYDCGAWSIGHYYGTVIVVLFCPLMLKTFVLWFLFSCFK